MGKYLDDFLLTMPDTQRKKLMELLEIKQQEGLIKSDYELKAELDRLMAQLNQYKGVPTFKARHQTGKTNSADYNSSLDEIAFDLMTLFSASGQIDQIITDNHQLSRSMLAELKKKVQMLDSQVERYKLIMQNTDGFVEGVHEQFQAQQYTETDSEALALLRKDRYGQYLADKYQGEIVADRLQLASYETIDQLKNPYGRKLADIRVVNRTGDMATNPEHPVDYAIDGSLESYWAEVVLSDEPITHDISDIWTHDYTDYPKDGAMTEIEIKLSGLTTVSEIQFDPYCAYPLEIVAVHGYESADKDAKMYALITPDHDNPSQRSKKSVGLISFQFPSVDISMLRVLMRQENYVKENYIVSIDEANQAELWQKIVNDNQLLTLGTDAIADKVSPGESIAEFDKKNELTGWNRYLSALKNWAATAGNAANSVVDAAKAAMDVVRTGNYKNPMQLALRSISATGQPQQIPDNLSQQWTAVSKLSYLYGFYNISLTGRKFQQRSIYVSKPLPINGNMKMLSLMTDEKHHNVTMDNGDAVRITDIEYYIAYKKNPDVGAWKPILPANKDYVEGELLFGSSVTESYPEMLGTIQFSFRFPIISADTVVLRRDGIPVPRAQYVISTDGKKLGIISQYYSASSIYTVDYKPVEDAYIVSIDETEIQPMQYINDQGETGETFAAVDDNNTVTIKHVPFVFRNQLFAYDDTLERYNQDDTQLQAEDLYYPVIVRVNGVEYKNITDYSSGTYDTSRLQIENEGHVFAQIGNQIIFPIAAFGDELKNITVDYYYLTTDVRLKAILRRNSAGYESVTPAVFSYSLRCQTYDQEVRNG
ncbi:hypothetical protein SAMN02799624_05416 [Paenibacillus sp. UNC496MF]|uniref:hypothetical protein n=1 Tax=Paenibacillus sp. UNC496MF TaxID=1502753 RepID=UPI0008F1B223|nr:hypothetical protein [Paenibacillus sp. UNC496MF]SFJ65773.1 hypothetical protein SAMN02799624_05416 [Paenibacillus sp. UNC496MF]